LKNATKQNDEVAFAHTRTEKMCFKKCNDPGFAGGIKECNSFAYAYNNASDSYGGCFTSEQNVMDFMKNKCKYKRGKVDSEAIDNGNFETLYPCIEDKIDICRRGDCKLDFLEPIRGQTVRAKDERTCLSLCQNGYQEGSGESSKMEYCSHYRWKIPAIEGTDEECELFYVKTDKNNPGKKSSAYECEWYAAHSNYAHLKKLDNGTEEHLSKDKLDVCKARGNKFVDQNDTDTGVDEIVCTKKFRVIHATKGGPVDGATVKWQLDHLEETAQTGTTDQFGEIEVNLTAKNLKEFDFMKIVVSKEGFDDQEIANVSIEGDSCEQMLQIPLNPKSKDGRIILTWDKRVPQDIDLYLIEFAQKQIDCKTNYEQMTPDCSNNTLDIDNKKGGPNGPETITVKDLDKAKTYMVLAHKFSSENTGHFCGSGARVAVCVGNQGCKQHYSIPKKCFEKSSVWLVGCFKGTTGPGDMKVIDKLIANDDQTQIPKVSPLPSISECGY